MKAHPNPTFSGTAPRNLAQPTTRFTASAPTLLARTILVTALMASPHLHAAEFDYLNAILASAPEAYWRLGDPDDTEFLTDETLQHPLTPAFVSGGELGATGALETIGDFNGSLNVSFRPQYRAQEASPSDSLDLTGPFTVETWIKPAIHGETVLGRYQDSPSTGFSLRVTEAGTPVFRTGNSTVPGVEQWNDLEAGYAQAGRWTHLAAVWDGSVKTLYVNGIRAGFEESSVLPAPTSPFTLGGGFNGFLDEVAFYRRALPASEILAHFKAAGRTPVGLPTIQQSPAGLVITWEGEEWMLESTVDPLTPGPAWEPLPDAKSPYAIPLMDNARFFRLTRIPSPQ